MDGTNLGIITLIPAISFLVFALVTKKCILSIMLSGILGYIFLLQGKAFFMPMMDALQSAACDADNNYIVIICLLFGCFVQLLRQSQGAVAVGNLARNMSSQKKQVLFFDLVMRYYHLHR